jgi:hypothetical protein
MAAAFRARSANQTMTHPQAPALNPAMQSAMIGPDARRRFDRSANLRQTVRKLPEFGVR